MTNYLKLSEGNALLLFWSRTLCMNSVKIIPISKKQHICLLLVKIKARQGKATTIAVDVAAITVAADVAIAVLSTPLSTSLSPLLLLLPNFYHMINIRL